MAFTLPTLPYDKKALAPHISEETLEFHHGKHHKAYVDNLNKLLEGKPEATKSLEDVIMSSEAGVFNNAAQIWNHTFYWQSMKPNGGGQPTGDLLAAINRDFGSVEKFGEQFAQAGATQFGSGWAWLVLEKGKLVVTKTGERRPADEARAEGAPHDGRCGEDTAYYIDYRNARPKYIETFPEEPHQLGLRAREPEEGGLRRSVARSLSLVTGAALQRRVAPSSSTRDSGSGRSGSSLP